jgi:cell shape-determining protein MreC
LIQDPREALILSLKREVMALQEENVHLRNLVDIEKTVNKEPQQRPGTSVIRSASPQEDLLTINNIIIQKGENATG